MWMSELSRRGDLPVATIKYYLREGLLHPGEAAGATRSHYDESHVRRLRLVRALVGVAGLRLEEVREVLGAVDDASLPLHEALGKAHTRLSASSSAPPPSADALARVDRLLRQRGWRVSAASAHREALARSLDALGTLDFAVSDELLDTYGAAMEAVAEHEVASVAAQGGRESATRQAVLGTLLLEPVLLTIRRMAQEHLSADRLGGPP